MTDSSLNNPFVGLTRTMVQAHAADGLIMQLGQNGDHAREYICIERPRLPHPVVMLTIATWMNDQVKSWYVNAGQHCKLQAPSLHGDPVAGIICTLELVLELPMSELQAILRLGVLGDWYDVFYGSKRLAAVEVQLLLPADNVSPSLTRFRLLISALVLALRHPYDPEERDLAWEEYQAYLDSSNCTLDINCFD